MCVTGDYEFPEALWVSIEPEEEGWPPPYCNPALGGCDAGVSLNNGALCDGSSDVRLVFLVNGGRKTVPDSYFYFGYEQQFLAIDGQCHFWTTETDDGRVLEGDLSLERAQELEQQLSFESLGHLGFRDGGCTLPERLFLWTPGGAAGCLCGCDGGGAELTLAVDTGLALLKELANLGTVTIGALSAAVLETDAAAEDGSVPWPLATDPKLYFSYPATTGLPPLSGGTGSATVQDSEDRRLLRAMRDDYWQSAAFDGEHPRYTPVYHDREAREGLRAYLRDEVPDIVREAIDAARTHAPQ